MTIVLYERFLGVVKGYAVVPIIFEIVSISILK